MERGEGNMLRFHKVLQQMVALIQFNTGATIPTPVELALQTCYWNVLVAYLKVKHKFKVLLSKEVLERFKAELLGQ